MNGISYSTGQNPNATIRQKLPVPDRNAEKWKGISKICCPVERINNPNLLPSRPIDLHLAGFFTNDGVIREKLCNPVQNYLFAGEVSIRNNAGVFLGFNVLDRPKSPQELATG
jgi:hypothetical protein